MAALPVIAMFASGVGTAISAAGQIQAGNQQRRMANFQARQLNQQAGQDTATAQREAIAQRNRATLANSTVKANAAASGGGVMDPSIVNLMGDITQQGEYNALSALYSGTERANGLNLQADAARVSGQNAQTAGNIGAASNLISGAGKIYSDYSLLKKYSPTGGSYR